MIRAITTFFYVGHLRPAPGTYGSLVALALGVLIDGYLGFPALLGATLAVTWLGFWACAKDLKDRPEEDPSEIVIDEVAGQWLALLFPAAAFFFGPGKEGFLPWPAWVGAFLLFRLFDIWKPSLVGKADARHDPVGVMLDDLWAGVFAGISAIVLGVLWHLVLFS
ncbi:phosphatidylglycerophosphatase A family protein [Thioclava sp. FR2]|uniref:phosphatidylglycerophosphatase A family protein n=1 Tax=Thioclava sp. FR2 TaxID=3445780 RepID=UPI003EBD7ACA